MFLFPASSLLTAEYDKIKEILLANCISQLGRNKIKNLFPQSDFNNLKTELLRTKEFKSILDAAENFPDSDYKDLSKELTLLKIENSVLQTHQLIDVLLCTRTSKEIFSFFKSRENSFLELAEIISDATFEKRIIEIIEEVIDDFGVIKNSASAELVRIRKNIIKYRAEADRLYNNVINKYRKEGWLTESQESSRNGRRVLSIIAEQKRALKGIIHDVSATGKTAFLEPDEVVGINNIVAEYEQEERLEIQRILKETTTKLRQYYFQLESYQQILGEFDFIRAKSLFAQQTKSNLPQVENKPYINLKNARHPLLFLHNQQSKKATIPFGLRLDGSNRILVISGPNAGGKTVCLKTIGLLQLMLQSGMLVPLDAESTMGIFENLMVDIGDSQSIEYELSTYSSRLKHMKVFLEKSNNQTLFLIDEFGSGTDPDLGGALAEAVLEELNNKNAFGIITTHYMNLKILADKSKGIVNGSMTFDAKNLKPLYQLNVGKPGSSYTFVVAERSGLSGNLINNARQKVNRKHVLLEQLLNKVEREKAVVTKKTEEVLAKEKKLHELIKQSEEIIFENEQLKNSVESRLKKNEQKTINQWEQVVRKFAKDFKETKNRKFVLDKFLGQLGMKRDRLSTTQKENKIIDPQIKKGVLVKLNNGKVEGIVEEIKGEKALVLFENVKTTCRLIDLVRVEKKK
jgi:DNA mismatch repair protein MutS2